jgi:hypothetical protein
MIDEEWMEQGSAFAERLSELISAEVEQERLTKKLLQITFIPMNSDATEIRLILSNFEVVMTAGHGTRFEFGPLSESHEKVFEFACAIAEGGLTEQIWPRRVLFTLRLQDGSYVRGRSISTVSTQVSQGQWTIYAPYALDGN